MASPLPAGRRPATYADLEALPPHVVGEIVGGELHVSPRPASPQALASSELGYELTGPFDRGRGGPGGWWILDAPELHRSGDVLVPALAGWRRSRMPSVPNVPAFTLAPDWLCEVLSPSTAGFDRVRKLAAYAREGVPHVWVLEPLNRTLEVLRLESGRWMVAGNYAGDQPVRAEPFDAVELDLLPLWGETRPPAEEP